MLADIESLVWYTDGSCNKHGKGGIGSILIRNGELYRVWADKVSNTTNNQMELLATYKALQYTKEYCLLNVEVNCSIQVLSDSQYVIKGIEEWLPNWKVKNWKNYAGKEVANKEYWLAVDGVLLDLKRMKNVTSLKPKWVKGHNNEPGNEVADWCASYDVDEGISEALSLENDSMDKPLAKMIAEELDIPISKSFKFYSNLYIDGLTCLHAYTQNGV